MSKNGKKLTRLPSDAAERKKVPLYTGCFKYFPDALIEVAKISQQGNDQHHPGTPLHWDKALSADEPDALLRHMIEGDLPKVAWRALAWLQRDIEANRDQQ